MRDNHEGRAVTGPARGRPSTYSRDLADEICRRLSEGRTLRDVCRDTGMPAESTVRTWALDDREAFSAQYARAREIGYHAMADELLEIADDGRNDWVERATDDGKPARTPSPENVQRSRLRVDTRKWLLGKALPKLYGNRLAVDANVATISHEEALRLLDD